MFARLAVAASGGFSLTDPVQFGALRQGETATYTLTLDRNRDSILAAACDTDWPRAHRVAVARCYLTTRTSRLSASPSPTVRLRATWRSRLRNSGSHSPPSSMLSTAATRYRPAGILEIV